MIHLSDPHAAARHGPADKVFDGLGMLAGIIGANTINVCGCGVEPQPAEPPAETSKAEPETRKRGSYTASITYLPLLSVAAAAFAVPWCASGCPRGPS